MNWISVDEHKPASNCVVLLAIEGNENEDARSGPIKRGIVFRLASWDGERWQVKGTTCTDQKIVKWSDIGRDGLS